MERNYAATIASTSEFRNNPAAILEQADHRSVAVLNNQRPAFYAVEPRLFEAWMDELANAGLHSTVRRRMADKSAAAVAVGAPGLYSKSQRCDACGGAGWVLKAVVAAAP